MSNRSTTSFPSDPIARAGVQGAVRAELDAIGDRLASFREAVNSEMERLAAFGWLTEQADLRPSDVAQRAGVSRQTLATLRSDSRRTGYQWPVDLRVLLELGLHGAQSAEGLRAAIAQPPVRAHEVGAAIDRLAREGLVAHAGKAPSQPHHPTLYWRLSPSGLQDLPRRLRHAATPPSRDWAAYVVSTPAEANAIVDAGQQALGQHGAVLIPAGTVHGMTQPEVAFHVEATDPQSAQATAVAVFTELRERAGMTPRSTPVVVSALVPPRRPAD